VSPQIVLDGATHHVERPEFKGPQTQRNFGLSALVGFLPTSLTAKQMSPKEEVREAKKRP